MASAGKGKNRRIKGKTVDLSSFLGDQKTAPGFAVINPKLDWADYVEEESEEKYTSYRKDEKQLVLPTAPKAARGPDFDVSKIPSEPPFTAYIGNLPFDITEDEIMRFFGNLPVISVRLPRDGGDRGRMRGFGYAEFENKQSLIEALSLNGETLKNRPVKVSLAGENAESDRNERKSDGIDRTASDWRAAPKSDDSFASRNQRNGSSKYEEPESRAPYRGRSSYGEDKGRFEGSRQSYQGRRSADRDRDFFSDRDNKGYRRYGDGGFDKGSDRSNWGEKKDDFEFKRDDRGPDRSNWGEKKDDFEFKRDDRGSDRSNWGEKKDDYEFKRDDRGSDRSNWGEKKDDYEFKRDDRGFNRTTKSDWKEGFEKDLREDDQDRGIDKKDRPRLQLKPRSVPVGEQPAGTPAVSSIFGGAKPVDTAAKEREIEVRLAKEREKLVDEGGKAKFTAWGPDDVDADRSIKKVETKRSIIEEPLREKNHTRADATERSMKERSEFVKSSSRISSSEQENGEPETFLSNKFAHLSPQEE